MLIEKSHWLHIGDVIHTKTRILSAQAEPNQFHFENFNCDFNGQHPEQITTALQSRV